MNQIKRRDYIVNKLNEQGEVSVIELSEELGVTSETIRRDLAYLEEMHLISKVHGGAIKTQNNYEKQFTDRLLSHKKQKVAIAKKAAAMLAENDTLFIDSCTTTLYFAEQIPNITLTVFTNSPLIANAIWERNEKAKIHLLGGRYFGELRSNLGAATLQQIEGVFADYAFVGAGAIDPKLGVMVKNMDEGNVAKRMLEQSRKKVVLTDSSKFGKNGLMRIAYVEDLECIITDKDAPVSIRSSFDNLLYVDDKD